MKIKVKTLYSGQVLHICCLDISDEKLQTGNVTDFEQILLEFEKKNKKMFDKLFSLIDRISNYGLDIYKMNTEKLEFMEKYKEVDILAIKIHGARILSVLIQNNKLVLLEIFKKKQNKYNRKNIECLNRAKGQVDLLEKGGHLWTGKEKSKK